MAERHTCNYPYCNAPVPPAQKGEHRYCLPHYSWIQSNKLCYKCLNKKETEDAWLCRECHRVETGKKRQSAIDAGLCTNYWKCTKPASRRVGMCAECFAEYNKKKFGDASSKPQLIEPVRIPPASSVISPAPPPATS